ncbi:MAG: hypothetical protein U0930_10975 [Pirellulales bacterium]
MINSLCLTFALFFFATQKSDVPASRLSLHHTGGPGAYDKAGGYDKKDKPSPRNRPYAASIINATSDPKLTSFLESVSKQNLESLHISHTTLTVEQARKIENISTPKLTISNCVMNEDVAKSLGSIVCQSLTLEQVEMSAPAFLAFMKGKANLSELVVSNCRFMTESSLGALRTLPLIKLSLAGCPVDDQCFRALSELSKLQELKLTGTQVTDEGVRSFVVSPNLSMINVAGTKVTQVWGLEITRQYQDNDNRKMPLYVFFADDSRWPPRGGYCLRGEFHLYK